MKLKFNFNLEETIKPKPPRTSNQGQRHQSLKLQNDHSILPNGFSLVGVLDLAGDLLRLNMLLGLEDSRLGEMREADRDRFNEFIPKSSI